MTYSIRATLLALLICGATLWGQQKTPAPANAQVQAAAESVGKYIRADPKGVEELFTPQFLAQISPSQLQALLAKLYAQLGTVTAVHFVGQQASGTAAFDFEFSKGYQAPVLLTLNGEAAHNIAGFRIGGPIPIHDSVAALLSDMRALPGSVSFLAEKLNGNQPTTVAQWQADKPLAIGSTFKLYILGALTQQVAEGKMHWDQVARLETHSLASGQLQGWPLGTPLTLQSLASLMISISDNTAADQLLHTVGRERVEAQQSAMGSGHAALNQPFLTTWEMFQLKYGDAGRRQTFLSDGAAARRSLLASLAPSATPELSAKLEAASSGTGPREIENLEWLESASDICHALAWFHAPESDRNRATARSILAINRGLPLSASKWTYIGFKGGSEPGVISLDFLLRSKTGAWYAVSAIWNNPRAAVNEQQWALLTSRAIDLLE
ncbi:MAG TPA: serine hydrolase [Terriglobales bacterium]|nr:serine hydrolase [Terriglobales bacterium]